MIILKVEKLIKLPNNLAKYLLTFLIACMNLTSYGQFYKKLTPKKIGFLYNFGTEDNFLFNDPDYLYTTSTYKTQLYYSLLENPKKLQLELVAQPQIQNLQHQLLNKFFVTPDEENYLEKQKIFTALKSMNLYGVEFAIKMMYPIIQNFRIAVSASLGFMFIDTETERLAKGFTFIENGSIGFQFPITKNLELYTGGYIGHVSNFDFLTPNDGYNILGYEFAFIYSLNKKRITKK